MMTFPAPAWPAAEVARRLGAGRAVSWWSRADEDDLSSARTFVACDPVEVVRGDDAAVLDDVATAWSRARARWHARDAGVPVAVGWVAYDVGAALIGVSDARARDAWPGLEFRFYDAVWTQPTSGAAPEIWAASQNAADALRARLVAGADSPSPPSLSPSLLAPPPTDGALVPDQPDDVFLNGVERVKDYLRAGDVYQINLARRLSARFSPDAGPPGWGLAARLARETAAPHAAWLVADDDPTACLIGNSPERFLRVDPDGVVETRPIKGTRARAVDPAADQRARDDLVASAKDAAELAMIVDLERNDLGRVCRTGSIEVRDHARVVSLPTVHHLVSTVRGRLADGVGLRALFQATFPGGSITGAPKRRAVTIIGELEPARRGIYTGATGWLGAAGDLDLAVAIRTAFARAGRLSLWVGAGIVIDSVAEAELAETNAKAAAFQRLRASGHRPA